ncbi:class I SAM-dependent DNA methyltransferase [Actinoplanes sp. NPDC051343]|uniref:class I SAM-dependent DNA methyltransferase n=1 Tax=Actinoplanes sp. NPDC051343 TaxID=3363906 RepID=UPI0037881702
MGRSRNLPSTSVKELYNSYADTYEHLYRRNDYDQWVGLYLDLIRRYTAPGRRLLDIGAGTGLASIRFASAGYDVTAFDISPEMLRHAAAKPGSENVSFTVADVRNLPDLGKFDVAVTLGEPFLYLLDEHELAAALNGVSGSLSPGGLLVFDLATEGFLQRLRSKFVIDDEDGSMTFMWGAESERDPRGADYLIERFSTDDGTAWRRSSHRHSYSHFPPDLVDLLLRRADLIPLGVHGLYKGTFMEHADEELHRKSFVIARKPN